MKLAISLIFSLGITPAVLPRCEILEKHPKTHATWSEFSQKFGTVALPRGISLCYGRSYFSELKNGATMQSALDRRRRRIILRRNSETMLRHELAHLYLDLSWKVLPYSASEPLATALAFTGVCNVQKDRQRDYATIRDQWVQLGQLDECERQQVVSDILSATPDVREKLRLP